MEQDIEYGDDQHKGEKVEDGCQDVEDHVQCQEVFVRRDEAPQDIKKIFHRYM
jgi:predicted CoA-binding protein